MLLSETQVLRSFISQPEWLIAKALKLNHLPRAPAEKARAQSAIKEVKEEMRVLAGTR